MRENLTDLLTVEDLMELLNIGKNTAYSLLEAGEKKDFSHRSYEENTKKISILVY